MKYEVEVYEQLRASGRVQYKVCAAERKSILWGLIKWKDRTWLCAASESSYYLGIGDEDFAHWFTNKEFAINQLKQEMDKVLERERANQIIHYKRIQ